MMNRTRVMLAVVISTLCVNVPGSAQIHESLPTLPTAECDTISIAATARPFVHDTLDKVGQCPSHFGATMAGLMSNYSLASTHPATYGLLFTMVSQYPTPATFDEAMDIAVDASAPLLARTWAVITLLNFRFNTDWRLSGDQYLSYSGPVGGCGLSGSLGLAGSFSGFPSAWYNDVDDLATAVVNSAAPLPVRHLARCIQSEAQAERTADQLSLGTVTNTTFNPSTNFSYVKQCGRKFLLRNSSYASVRVKLVWGDYSGAERDYMLPPRKEGESYSEVSWTVPGSNSYAGVGYLVQSLMNETPNNTPC